MATFDDGSSSSTLRFDSTPHDTDEASSVVGEAKARQRKGKAKKAKKTRNRKK